VSHSPPTARPGTENAPESSPRGTDIHPGRVKVINPFWSGPNNTVRRRTADHWVNTGRAERLSGDCVRMTSADKSSIPKKEATAAGYDGVAADFIFRHGQSDHHSATLLIPLRGPARADSSPCACAKNSSHCEGEL